MFRNNQKTGIQQSQCVWPRGKPRQKASVEQSTYWKWRARFLSKEITFCCLFLPYSGKCSFVYILCKSTGFLQRHFNCPDSQLLLWKQTCQDGNRWLNVGTGQQLVENGRYFKVCLSAEIVDFFYLEKPSSCLWLPQWGSGSWGIMRLRLPFLFHHT